MKNYIKKITASIFAIVFTLSFLGNFDCFRGVMSIPVSANAVTDFIYDTDGDYGDEGYGIIISGYTGTATEVYIPETINDLPVVIIGAGAFGFSDMKGSITKVVIPNTVETIEASAFRTCTAITTIDIPDSVTIIGNNAFDGCTSLMSIKLPTSIERLGTSAFAGCTSARSIYAYNESMIVGQNAFKGCTDITVHSYMDSAMHDYAIANNFKFVAILDDVPDNGVLVLLNGAPASPTGNVVTKAFKVKLIAGNENIDITKAEYLFTDPFETNLSYRLYDPKLGITKKIGRVDFTTQLSIRVGTVNVTYPITVDVAAPILTVSSWSEHDGKTPYTDSGALEYDIEALDEGGSGFRGITYKLSKPGSETIAVPASMFSNDYFTLALTEQGKYTVAISAYDNVGRVRKSKTIRVNIDNESPLEKDVAFKLNGLITPSGVTDVFSNKPLNKLSFGFIPPKGVTFSKVISYLYNSKSYETVPELLLAIGNAEVATIGFSLETLGGMPYDITKTIHYVPLETSGFLKPVFTKQPVTNKAWQSSDVTVDFEVNNAIRVTYIDSLNKTPEIPISGNSLTFTENGKRRITIYAYDYYGNKASSKPFEVKIDKTEPSIYSFSVDGRIHSPDVGSVTALKPVPTATVTMNKKNVSRNTLVGRPVISNGSLTFAVKNEVGIVKDYIYSVNSPNEVAPPIVKISGKTMSDSLVNQVNKMGVMDVTFKMPKGGVANDYTIKYKFQGLSATGPDPNIPWTTYKKDAKPSFTNNSEGKVFVQVIYNMNGTSTEIVTAIPYNVEFSPAFVSAPTIVLPEE